VQPRRLHGIQRHRCHGPIKLEPLLVRVMDTVEFQRLRNLKQLGGSSFVYPDASHSRFEHSIGVAHLSRRMVGTCGVLIASSKVRPNITDAAFRPAPTAFLPPPFFFPPTVRSSTCRRPRPRPLRAGG